MIADQFRTELEAIDSHLRVLIPHPANSNAWPELKRFSEGLSYSLFSGGKRFRPLLSLLTAKALGSPYSRVLPLASAVELIHTYSLIHDDMPCMDNDDLRRGQPTHHKKYGEGAALLAGDALLTMAFEILATSPSPRAAQAVALLAIAAGPDGMIGGQVLDVESSMPPIQLLTDIHQKKTGALIRVSIEAAAVLCEATSSQITSLRAYGEHLGMAFQLADDLQDFDPKKPEKISFAAAIGIPATIKKLDEETEGALAALKGFPATADSLRELAEFNRDRA